MKRSLPQLGEDALVALLTRGWPGARRRHPGVLLGPGDDCAVLRAPGCPKRLLFKTDAVVEGVHFTADATPWKIGWKALARCISDVAAMGGTPAAAVVTLGLAPGTPPLRVRAVYRGIERCARRFDIALVGGETVRAPALFLSVAMTGWVPQNRLVLRSGARPGHLLCVTGRLGAASTGRHLTFQPRLKEACWLVAHARPSAMMDLSDGLAADLPRLCRASRVGAALDPARIPVAKGASLQQALRDGEDYELLFTLPADRFAALRRRWPFPTPVTQIGAITAGSRIHPPMPSHGYDHLRQP